MTAPLPGSEAIARLRRIYRGADGFPLSAEDRRIVERSRGSSIYGELMPTATVELLAKLELGRRDVFYDLGAGIAKVVLLAAATTKVGRAVGVELAPGRAAIGAAAIASARAERLPGAERASLIEADMLGDLVDLADATVVYTCSTAFSTAFLTKILTRLLSLPKLRTLVSLREIERPGFDLVAVPRLDASWKRRTKVHLYARTRTGTITPRGLR